MASSEYNLWLIVALTYGWAKNSKNLFKTYLLKNNKT